MKLFLVLSVIAYGYAAKLDRTYLPPASAASAGGSPGSLAAPFGSAGPSNQGFGQSPGFGSTSGPSFTQPAQSSGFEKASPNFGQSFGNTDQSTRPSNQYGAPTSSGLTQGLSGRGSSAPGFEPSGFGQSQDGARFQPERAQASADRNAEILRYENENDGNTFAYNFETSNGISAEESGVATNGVQAQGGYSYTADDGEVYRVTYTADENGYQPQGDHLPTSPPIPDEILRSIEENARAAAAGTQEGAYQPDDNESGNSFQQYSGTSPSFNQGQTYNSQGSAQGSSQKYGAPNAASGPSRSFAQAQGTAQSPSQQYGAPNTASRPFESFNQAQSGQRNQLAGSSFNRDSSTSPSGSQASSFLGRGSTQSSQVGSQSSTASFTPLGSTSRQDSVSAQTRQQGDNGYQYNRPQGPNGSFSGSRQDQSSVQSPSQQYGAPTAFGRGSNQGTSQQYSAPGRGSSQGPSQQYATSGSSSQQYNIPSVPSRGSNQVPSKQNGAPSVGSGTSGSFAQAQSGPRNQFAGSTSFNRDSSTAATGSQGPSSQYDAPTSSGRGSSQSQSQRYNAPSTSNGFNRAPSQQYGVPATAGREQSQGSQQFGSQSNAAPFRPAATTQSNTQGAFAQGQQAQDESGYQYNRPQGAPFGQGSGARPQSSGQYQNQQSSASQYNQPTQSAFARPGSASSQGVSTGPGFSTGPTTGPGFSTGPTTGPAAALVSQSLLPGSRANGARPTQSSFGTSGSSQSSFGSTQGNLGSQGTQVQGSSQYRPGQSATKEFMVDSAQYSRPGAPTRQTSQSTQSNFSPASPTFGGPRQPPSFSPENGYVY